MLLVALIPNYKRNKHEKKMRKVVTQGKVTEKNKEKAENKRELRAATEDSKRKTKEILQDQADFNSLSYFRVLFTYKNVLYG